MVESTLYIGSIEVSRIRYVLVLGSERDGAQTECPKAICFSATKARKGIRCGWNNKRTKKRKIQKNKTESDHPLDWQNTQYSQTMSGETNQA